MMVFELFEAGSPLYTISLVVALAGIAITIAFTLKMKNWLGILVLFAIVLITSYAWGVLSQLWGFAGFIIVAIAVYILTKKKDDMYG